MIAPQQKIRNVVVVARLSFQSGRDILYGVSKFAAQHCRWRFHIIADTGSPSVEELRAPERHKIDGIIADSVLYADALALLRKSSVPIVLIGPRPAYIGKRSKAIAFVMNDDESIGRLGARHLASLGRFRSFGFVPHVRHNYCTDARESGFCAQLGALGKFAYVYKKPAETTADSLEEVRAIAEWLAALPKPAAVMAVHDLKATTVMEAAHLAKIHIPQDLAIIGVDNDALLCDFTDPPLTSIAPDHAHEGEIAAEKLDRLLRGKACGSEKPYLNTRKTIVERQSARPLAPGAHLAEAAKTFIEKEAANGIAAADVARHLGVSRRLAEMRFRQFENKSILDAITEARLGVLKRRLAEDGATIGQTILGCGFRNESYAKRLFKSRFGMTMSDYRARSGKA